VVLSRLFQTAIRAGKRARTETRISHNQVSIASLAAKLSEELIPALQDAEIVILGAGEMAELSVEAMRKRKASAILVVNRTQERARSLADRWQAESDTFENLAVALSRADVLVSSTGAPHLMISSSMVSKAMTVRPDRPLLLIDLAVPRDIDPQVAQIPNVHLYDIDGLNANLERSLNERAKEIPQVQAILAEESGAFSEFLQSLDMRPLIVDLRQQAETLRQMELEKTLRRLPNLTDDERQRIEALTLSLVNKMLHSPTLRLREEANCPHAPQYAAVARTLFGLSGDRCACHFSDKSCPLCAAD
jgi:glutamyl-tRNA reductase